MSRWAVAAAALALLLASGAAAAGLTIADAPYTTKWPAVELSASVVAMSFFELQPQNLNGKTVVPCQDAVDKAKELNMGAKRTSGKGTSTTTKAKQTLQHVNEMKNFRKEILQVVFAALQETRRTVILPGLVEHPVNTNNNHQNNTRHYTTQSD